MGIKRWGQVVKGLNSALSTPALLLSSPPSLRFRVLLFWPYCSYPYAMWCPGSPLLLSSQYHDGNTVKEMNAKSSLWSYLLPHPGNNW